MTATPGRARHAVWPLLAATVGIAITIALGNWQLGRGHEKRELKARLEASMSEPPINVTGAELHAKDVELRRVEARGIFEPRHVVMIDNRIHRGVPGYHVVMPLKLEGSDRYVLVNRGWIARGAERSALPPVRSPQGVVSVSGIATVPGTRMLELSSNVMEGRVWQNLTIERYREAMPISVQPFVIRQDPPRDPVFDDGLIRVWDPPDFGIDKHYGYAFQWFALAATILVFYAITRYRRTRNTAP